MSAAEGTYRDGCELSFIWGKMRAAVQETAPQSASRDRSLQEVEGKVSICAILVKAEYIRSSTYLLQNVSAGHEEWASPGSIIVLF